MGDCLDPFLQRLMDDLDAARRRDIPVLSEVRKRRERIARYFTWCVCEEIRRHGKDEKREPRFRVIANDGPVQHNPRQMSSPVKTDEIRAFEAAVGRVFGIRASAKTEWPSA
jgi:hypothetical protein